MTARELHEQYGYSVITIKKRVEQLGPRLERRLREGTKHRRPQEFLITDETLPFFKKNGSQAQETNKPARETAPQSEPRSATTLDRQTHLQEIGDTYTIITGIRISPEQEYSFTLARQALRAAQPDLDEKTTRALWETIRVGEGAPGSKLAVMVRRVAGITLLNEHAYLELSRHAGVNYQEVKPMLDHGSASQHVQSIGASQYYENPKLDEIIQALQKDAYGTTNHKKNGNRPKPMKPDKQAKKPTIEVTSNSHRYELDPARTYAPEELRKYLQPVHATLFSGRTIDTLTREIGDGQGIKGKALAELLQSVDGLILIGTNSGKIKLEAQLGMSWDDIEPVLYGEEGGKYRHTLPGVPEQPFVLARETDELRELLRKDNNTLAEWHNKLNDHRIMPHGQLYENLKAAGVLDERSDKAIAKSYSRFMQAMQGWQLYNFERLRAGTEMEWKDFHQQCTRVLIQHGLVKNLLEDFGARGKPVYVLKEGQEQEAKRVLNL